MTSSPRAAGSLDGASDGGGIDRLGQGAVRHGRGAGRVIIALEEHYFDPLWNDDLDTALHAPRSGSPLLSRMADLGERRIAEMDEAGIDVQVISQDRKSTLLNSNHQCASRLPSSA